MRIPGFRNLNPFAVTKKSVAKFIADDMMTYASALAFQIIFSIFPFIIFFVALLAFLDLSTFFEWLREQAQMVLPQQAMSQVNDVIEELQQPQGGLLSIGAIVALWVASAGVRAAMAAMNVAYNVREGRPPWKLYPLSILYTTGLAAMLIAAAALMVVGPQAMEWLAAWVGLERYFITLWTWVRLPTALLLFTLAIAIVYYVGPNVRQTFKLITPGAVVCVLVWIIASFGFDIYVRNFADYSAMYGSVGTIVLLLFYFYISSAVLLFGAELNAVIEHAAPEAELEKEKQAA